MKRGLGVIVFLSLILILSLAFVSAGTLGSFWSKITGYVISPNCDLTSASWSNTSVSQGQQVKLYVKGINCEGKSISFVVMEKDTISDDSVKVAPLIIQSYDSSKNYYGTWTAEWQNDNEGLIEKNPPEYYFIAKVIGTSELIKSPTSAGMLMVNPCVSETSAVFCSRLAKNCGSVTAADNCGTPRTVANCGTCSFANAVSTCSAAGVCLISSCNSGYANCDGNTANGCETQLGTNTNCASCNNVCSSGQTCQGGACVVANCSIFKPCITGYTCQLDGSCTKDCTSNTQCNDNNACTTDSCLNGICMHASITNCCTFLGSQCNDNNACTSDSCSNNVCKYTPITSAVNGDGCCPSNINPVNDKDCSIATCTRETNSTFCSRLGKNCGSVTANDNCGISRTVTNCGTCASGQTCSNGVCVGACTPTTTCTSLGKNCGSISNNCGGTLNCGTCSSGQICSNNVCISSTCTAETNFAFCRRLGIVCGKIIGIDNCGTSRTVTSCGVCSTGLSCSGGKCISGLA